MLYSNPLPTLINASFVFFFKKKIHASAKSSENVNSLLTFPVPQNNTDFFSFNFDKYNFFIIAGKKWLLFKL